MKHRSVLFHLIIPNIVIILSLCFITFTVLDWYNPLMNFTANEVSAKLLLLFCTSSIVLSVHCLFSKQ